MRPAHRWFVILAVVYAVGLALVAFWPQHVDKDLSPFIEKVIAHIPLLTYPRLEFAANIVLFIPLGIILALIARRYLVFPLGFLISLCVESVQALLLDGRTPSLMDVVANTAGACIGLLIVEFAELLARHTSIPPETPAKVSS